jgi:hypothetical protein
MNTYGLNLDHPVEYKTLVIIPLRTIAIAGMRPADKTGTRMATPIQTSPTGRGRPFTTGNGGRKPGSKNRTTQIAAALLEGDAEELVRKAKELALAGDVAMLKFLLGRILPRDRTIKIDLPHAIYGDDDPVAALTAIIRAVAEGKVSPSEGAALATLMESYRRASEQDGLTKRMDELEARLKEH